MAKYIYLILCLLLASFKVSALDGSWRGEIEIGRNKLPLVFNFTSQGDSITLCTLDSPAQGARGIPVDVLLFTNDSISLCAPTIGLNYNGHVSTTAIIGRMQQGFHSINLELTPEIPIEQRRPQTPRPPYPYSVVDTTFMSSDGNTLAATITFPEHRSHTKVPVLVMVSGSGPQNRDEEIFEHKPFAVIADFLARHGIASIRYDDRGVGASEGDFTTSTTYTFRDDAAAAADFARSLPQAGHVGVLGHSEGGTIAFMLAGDGKVDFAVSLAGVAESGKETLMRQNLRALGQAGLNDAQKADCLKLLSLIFNKIIDAKHSDSKVIIDIDSIASTAGINVPEMLKHQIKNSINKRSLWMDEFLALDARTYVAEIRCPLLAINGELDTQVDAKSNLAIIRELVPTSETRLMPGLNHLMQHCTTGDVAEYGDINETIAPEVLQLIVDFIRR